MKTSAVPSPTRVASRLAGELLASVGTRLAHTQHVASQARRVARLLAEPWSAALIDAAWLHDVGYNSELAEVGFHPLDGARWLRRHGWPEEVCRLVAYHTRADTEAHLRGLGDQLEAEFEPPPPLASAAMAWCDLTSSSVGQCCTIEHRLADILERYPSGTVVHRATLDNRPTLESYIRQIETMLPAQ